jgi:prostaglandin-E synthase
LFLDVTNETIQLTDDKLVFKGTSGGKEYDVDLEFFKPIVNATSTYKVLPRSVQMHIMKKQSENEDDDEEFWPRLLKDKVKEKNQVAVDWDRYVDEDDQDGGEGFDTSALEGGRGMGGMGGGMGGTLVLESVVRAIWENK